MNKLVEEKQMIEYKPNWWNKFKQKLFNFLKIKTQKPINTEQETSQDPKTMPKEEFMEIYKGVKEGTVDMKTLDNKTLERIMILLNEEINLTYNMLKDNLNKIDLSLINMKMYNKEVDIMKNKK